MLAAVFRTRLKLMLVPGATAPWRRNWRELSGCNHGHGMHGSMMGAGYAGIGSGARNIGWGNHSHWREIFSRFSWAQIFWMTVAKVLLSG